MKVVPISKSGDVLVPRGALSGTEGRDASDGWSPLASQSRHFRLQSRQERTQLAILRRPFSRPTVPGMNFRWGGGAGGSQRHSSSSSASSVARAYSMSAAAQARWLMCSAPIPTWSKCEQSTCLPATSTTRASAIKIRGYLSKWVMPVHSTTQLPALIARWLSRLAFRTAAGTSHCRDAQGHRARWHGRCRGLGRARRVRR